MQMYETLYIAQPGLSEEEQEALGKTFDEVVTSGEGNLVKSACWGKRKLAYAITAAESKGGTALYDAIWRTARDLKGFDGRRVMVLLSDGRDEAYAGLQPGSLHPMCGPTACLCVFRLLWIALLRP